MLNILFICTGNTCRSPMAEALFNARLQEAGLFLKVKASSAGLAVLEGQAVSEPVRQLLNAEKIDMSGHRARQVNYEIIENADLVLTMTGTQLKELIFRFPSAGGKSFLFKSYAGANDGFPDIEDPFGGSLEKYQEVLEEIKDSVKKLTLKFSAGNGNKL